MSLRGVSGNQPVAGGERTLWVLTGANMNTTADQAFVQQGVFSTYIITAIRCVNASTSLTLAAGGIYNTASKGGTPLVAAAQVYSGLTGSTLGINLTLAAFGTGVQSGAALYLALTTGQGGAATCDFYVVGVPLT